MEIVEKLPQDIHPIADMIKNLNYDGKKYKKWKYLRKIYYLTWNDRFKYPPVFGILHKDTTRQELLEYLKLNKIKHRSWSKNKLLTTAIKADI